MNELLVVDFDTIVTVVALAVLLVFEVVTPSDFCAVAINLITSAPLLSNGVVVPIEFDTSAKKQERKQRVFIGWSLPSLATYKRFRLRTSSASMFDQFFQ